MKLKLCISTMVLACIFGQASINAQAVIEAKPTKQLTKAQRTIEFLKAVGWSIPAAASLFGSSFFMVCSLKGFSDSIFKDTSSFGPVSAAAACTSSSIVAAYLTYYTSKWSREALTKAYHGKELVEELEKN